MTRVMASQDEHELDVVITPGRCGCLPWVPSTQCGQKVHSLGEDGVSRSQEPGMFVSNKVGCMETWTGNIQECGLVWRRIIRDRELTHTEFLESEFYQEYATL